MIWLLKAYQHALKVHPIRTAAISAGGLLSVGDVLAQLVVEKTPFEKYNSKRTVRFAIFGTFFGGPMFSVWYSTLARRLGHAKYSTIKMVACDQFLFAPPFIAYFLIVMEILKGESLQDIKLKLQDDYLDVMKTNYKCHAINQLKDIKLGLYRLIAGHGATKWIWPAVQAINFTFVPVHYRVVLVNFVAVGWNTYLAWMSEKTHSSTELEESTTVEETEAPH